MVEQQQQHYISPALPHSDLHLEAPNLANGARSSSTSSYYSTVRDVTFLFFPLERQRREREREREGERERTRERLKRGQN